MNKNKMRSVRNSLHLLCENLNIARISVMSNGSLRIEGNVTRSGSIPGYRFPNRWPGAKSGLFRMNGISRKERKRQVEGMKAKGESYRPFWFGKDVISHRVTLEKGSATQEALSTKRKEI